MKRLLLIIFAIFSFVGAHAQAPYLETGDIVSISFKDDPWNVRNYYTYMVASNSGILSTNVVNDDCLWELTVDQQTNTYSFRDLTTGKYLRINNTGSNQESLQLTDAPDARSAFSFTDKGGERGKYMFGQLYYNTVTHWGAAVSLMISEYSGIFLVAGWNAYDLYIEKWEQKGAGKPTGHFSPSKIEFTYAKDETEAEDQAREVSFMIEATTESYYQCIRRPDEALLRRSTGDVEGGAVKILNVYWESDSINKVIESKLDVSKYVAPQDENRILMTISDPISQNSQWQFTITPVGASPMGLKQKIYEETVNGTTVGIDRWVDYADRVVVEYQYGESEPQKAHMRVVRKSYREEELPALTFSINPLTYNFNPAGESKVFDVKAMHQHGKVIYNVDDQVIKTTYENETPPQEVDLKKANITYSFINNNVDNWLTYEVYSSNQIRVTASSNEGEGKVKRSDTLVVTMTPQNHSDHTPVSFSIPLDQRAKIIEGGIRFIPNMGVGNTSFETNPYTHEDQQKVHTVEKTIYYLPNQAEIELRLQESGYSGYMRWYDYETGGDPYYNYTHGKQATSWVRSPRGNQDKAFSAINTPRKGNTPEEMNDIIANEGHSHGLYSLNKADGGALDEDNPYNNNPIIKGWADGAAHIMACDVSAYTDYTVEEDDYGQITSITEPTLSYRQIFHLKPASEMAEKFVKLGEDEYLEEYKYQAPAGKQILLATQYRYKKARSHFSEMCYFYKDVNGDLVAINANTPVVWKEFTKNSDGTLTENPNFVAQYSAEMDYLIVRSETYPTTKVYTLVLPVGAGGWAQDLRELRIARFEVEFVDIEKQGPTNKTIITQQRINTQYNNLAEINFDKTTGHLPWEEASYGYVYTEGELATQFKRGATQGAFPFYGEYIVTEGVDKDWARASAHGGTGKALYVDGTMEPGLVASITAPAKICSGQTMYCSAWLCNPAPSGWSGEGNPIFRCNIQGKDKGETEWHDAGVYFVGELLKGTGWQQIVFPIHAASSYDETRVSIYNFATTNQGNDFMVDDITLFVSQLPIAAYQGKMACRTTGDETTSAAAVLRLDYSNIQVGSDGYIYYQIYNESYDEDSDGEADGAPVNLTGEAAYYHDYDDDHHLGHDHPYGSVHIPEANFNPEEENNKIKDANNNLPESEKKDTFLIYQSVSKMLDEMAASGTKHAKAYIKTSNSGVTKWLLYVAHMVENVTESQVNQDRELPLQKLYDKHKYSMRMAYSHDELSIPACNMQTPLHATQQTVFHLRNSDGEKIKHQKVDRELVATKIDQEGLVENIFNISTNNCANDLYFLTSKVVNGLALEVGGNVQNIEAPIYADWLVGEEFDDVYNTGRPVTGSEEKITADNAFFNKYGYTRGQVASAIMYDMRRVPTKDEPNPNYTARSVKELQPSAFQSYQNYEIVKHLCDSGWLQMYDTTTHFYLESESTARYWCFPIQGTSITIVGTDSVVLKDCNEPKWVSISAQHSDYYINIAPIKKDKKTNQQKTQIPTIKLLKNQLSNVTIPITESSRNIKISGMDEEQQNIIKDITNGFGTDGSFINLETGRADYNSTTLEPGKEYTIRLEMKDEQNRSHIGEVNTSCRVGYVFLTIQVVPNTLVWTPDGTTFTGWGLNDNWKGLIYDANGNITDTVEGFVPISGADVIIPKLDNPLAYPYIVHEGDTEHGHKHNHYPMTIGFEPHSCGNIYFAPGALLHNQHVLHYAKAFVDMQITAGGWNMMSAPLQGMVSGDMFIPHKDWWSSGSNHLIAEPDPFVVSGFQGIRHADAAYAFWEAFYKTTVDGDNILKNIANLEFIQSNTLVQPLTTGTGYQLYGLGWKEKDTLTIRLPKPDLQYAYYADGAPNGNSVTIPATEEERGKLAYNGETNIELTNSTASEYFFFGNPTMAYIDMYALYKDNNSIWSGVFKTMKNSQLNAATQLTLTTSERYLPPMTSVLLKVKDNATEAKKKAMTITLNPSHLTLNNTITNTDQTKKDNENQSITARRIATYEAERPRNENAQATQMLTIYALGKNATARTVLATNPIANDYYQAGEDALFISTGVENQSYVTSPLNMYTVAEQVPMMADVRQGISNIPLSILAADNTRAEYMQLAFYLTSNWSRECYFCDSQTGQKIRIMDGLVITIEMPLNHEQRYYIEGPDTYQGSDGVETSTTQPSVSTTGNKVWAYAPDRSTVIVSSSDLIKSATLYDITGRLITQSSLNSQLSTLNSQLMTNTLTLHTASVAGVYIVDVTLRDGSTEQAQVIIQ